MTTINNKMKILDLKQVIIPGEAKEMLLNNKFYNIHSKKMKILRKKQDMLKR
jgi:hypothetical protein